ncbi:MAG: D-alanyl-D-alanine dipeptidase [Aphanocapsa feldmannii 277cV]|uniref:D-alanyl-D-alanine dipeptidase n=2 Tax=Aphanocapsa feldmannii TaxID=192050 RepID=A0A524RL86_9CHRO|nr:MAG: D-alanyl-D-alanine dipeptidase [Aphanocapsa feldmannii 288cV]TGG90818.1 MAG: D-alanyl-D-alanine dipeptidase [Aphanocapsa feldmannii 277cV]TGH19756.1 MAG: D-alanyl-D-alanine dipeptidase [Aphanocapsa feldmannii 277cI]
MPGNAPAEGKPWLAQAIRECGEPLVELPGSLGRWDPHPYACLGAPYPSGSNPFFLRLAVVQRLLRARSLLLGSATGLDLIIFDAWRPLAVQTFMVNRTIRQELARLPAAQRGDPHQLALVRQRVNDFWAEPSADPATPPPHSTGAAVDLTLQGRAGPLDMGSPIDAMGECSHPFHFADATDPGLRRAHASRLLLRSCMARAGFTPHPLEWWHFSYGDQLWSWSSGAGGARYGRLERS